jgi:hypothetical protein
MEELELGVVTHYFGHLAVAAVKLEALTERQQLAALVL